MARLATPDDVFGHWSVTDEGASRVYVNEPMTCRVSFDVEITPDTVSMFVAPDNYVTAYLARTAPDGRIHCTGDGATGRRQLMYAGEIRDRSRMGGSIPLDYWNRDGTWLALRQ